MLDASETRLLRKLRAALNERIKIDHDTLASGALPDHASYRHRCGHLLGLRDALAMAEDIEKQINGDR